MTNSSNLVFQHTQLASVFDQTSDALMVVLFAKTASPYYKLAVNIAEGATQYAALDLSGLPVHVCRFGKTAEQAARCVSLMGYTRSWASTQVFAAGRLIDGRLDEAMETLRCYQNGCASADSRAHCQRVAAGVLVGQPVQRWSTNIVFSIVEGVHKPAPELPAQRLVFPCKRILRDQCLDPDHPATLNDQLQALAVEHEAAWCPLFDADALEML